MGVSARENLASDLAGKYVRDGLVYQIENFDSQDAQVISLPEAVWNIEQITLECCFEENSGVTDDSHCCTIGSSTVSVTQMGWYRRLFGGKTFIKVQAIYSNAWKIIDRVDPLSPIVTQVSQSVDVNDSMKSWRIYDKGTLMSSGQSSTSRKLADFKNMYLGNGIFYHSIRIYNKILSDEEVKQNWLIDERRLGI